MRSETKLKSYLEEKYSHFDLVPYDLLQDELLVSNDEAIALSIYEMKNKFLQKKIFIKIILEELEEKSSKRW